MRIGRDGQIRRLSRNSPVFQQIDQRNVFHFSENALQKHSQPTGLVQDYSRDGIVQQFQRNGSGHRHHRVRRRHYLRRRAHFNNDVVQTGFGGFWRDDSPMLVFKRGNSKLNRNSRNLSKALLNQSRRLEHGCNILLNFLSARAGKDANLNCFFRRRRIIRQQTVGCGEFFTLF